MQQYIAAVPGWKSEVGGRLDRLILDIYEGDAIDATAAPSRPYGQGSRPPHFMHQFHQRP